YAEDAGWVSIDAGLTLSDADSSGLVGATITITGYVAGQDELSFTAQAGITASWNATTGVLTLSGAASPASYQAALRDVTSRNTSNNPSLGARAIQITVDDGADTSTASRTLTLSASDDAPSIAMTAAALAYTEGSGAVAIDTALTLSDPDSASLTGA